ncbi:hypothetical protein SCUCBS95973_008948 [Sporothrix curviconia]|uniref:Uncharacterized protein n=1 Tax=Sporothrix curviconia TaxID=1260050 RepID=A0ABP0CQR3_9PEZI
MAPSRQLAPANNTSLPNIAGTPMDIAHAQEANQHASATAPATTSLSSISSPTLSTAPLFSGMATFVGSGTAVNGHLTGVAIGVTCAVMAMLLMAAAYGMTRHLRKQKNGGDNDNLGGPNPHEAFRMQSGHRRHSRRHPHRHRPRLERQQQKKPPPQNSQS